MVGDDRGNQKLRITCLLFIIVSFVISKGWTKMITEDIPSNDLGGKVGGDFVISNLGEGYKATNFPDAKGWVGANEQGLLKR